MTDDLLASRRLMGLTEPQVRALLGEPDSTDHAAGEQLWVYQLGRQRDFPVKSFWFPGFFPNHEAWMLLVRFQDRSAHSAEVFFN